MKILKTNLLQLEQQTLMFIYSNNLPETVATPAPLDDAAAAVAAAAASLALLGAAPGFL